ncbi:MAG: tetratricopeptide repeat protein [Sphingobacteriaceae bacterium]|nr:tetratricopeptide repeat protein [Sphingobacteriaceae bacterium]
MAETNLKALSTNKNGSVEFKSNNSINSPRIKFFKTHLGNAYNLFASYYESDDDFINALLFYKKGLKICSEIDDKNGSAYFLKKMASIYFDQGNINNALDYQLESLKIYEEIDNKEGIANSTNVLGIIYNNLGNEQKALEYYNKSLKTQELIGNKIGIGEAVYNLGHIYGDQGDESKEIEYYTKALKLFEESGSKSGIAFALSGIGIYYFHQKNIPKSLECLNKCLQIRLERNDKRGISECLNNLGFIYNSQGDIQKALEFYHKSLNIKEEIGDKDGMTYALNHIGFIYFERKNYPKAIEYCSKSMKISKELGFPATIRNAAEKLNQIYSAMGDHKNALLNYKLFITMRDSINNIANKKASIKNQLKYEYDKKALADSLQLAETKKLSKAQLAESTAKLKQEKTQRFALITGLTLVLIFLIYTFIRFRHSQKQKKRIEHQKILVDQSQKKIVDSINYAKKIQNSILPSGDEISAIFPKHFIFFKPKDIVSGDFYWFYHRDHLSFIAVADCTGHGVPGAFMTMIASAGLNEVIIEQNSIQPEIILSSLHSTIFKGLQQQKGDEYSQDGLDISLAVIDHKSHLLHFSGAHNHGFLIDNGEIRTLKASPKSIGGLNILGEIEPNRKFKGETYQLNKDSILILSTDGIYDQLNPSDEKFGLQRFKELILRLNSDDNLVNLKTAEQTFNNWKQEVPQLDDILMIKIKL